MRERLVFMPDQIRQRGEEFFRTDDYFVMVRLVGVGDDSRVSELVRFAFCESD